MAVRFRIISILRGAPSHAKRRRARGSASECAGARGNDSVSEMSMILTEILASLKTDTRAHSNCNRFPSPRESANGRALVGPLPEGEGTLAAAAEPPRQSFASFDV